jgi:hypothetical protein
MEARNPIQRTGKKRVMHTVLSSFVIAIAVALLVYMISVEGELGALPLLLLVLGIGWLAIARLRMRPR